jgi:hypothetical protein
MCIYGSASFHFMAEWHLMVWRFPYVIAQFLHWPLDFSNVPFTSNVAKNIVIHMLLS